MLAAVVWLQLRMRRMAQQAAAEGSPPPAVIRCARWWGGLGCVCAMAVVFFLMVNKANPGWVNARAVPGPHWPPAHYHRQMLIEIWTPHETWAAPVERRDGAATLATPCAAWAW